MTSPSSRLRRIALSAVFLGAIVLVVALSRGRPDEVSGAAAPPGFSLQDVAGAVGIDFVHHGPTLDPRIDNIAPLVGALGASVSVSDVNNDGWPDLYFTNSRFGFPNALYVNRGDGTFSDVAARAGLADLNRPGEGVSMGSVWGDYDNDGLEDLLVYKWGYLQLFKNLGDLHFVDVTAAAGLRHWMNSNGAVWLDYDRDGLLDLYVTGYFRSDVDFWHLKTTRIMHNSFEFATNGGMNRLFRNLGGGRFEDVTARTGVGSTRWTLAAAAADFNGDGWPDLFLANDYGPEELFLNDSGARFVLTRAGLESDSKSGMSASLGDVLNRGRLDAFVTNISERGYLFQGNNLRLNFLPELGRFEQGAAGGGVVADAGWAWGAQIGDLDNDGRNELFITNGYVSADRDKSYWYAMSKVAGANGNVFEDTRNWPAIGTASLSGFERSRVLVNRGVAGWVDVGPVVGVTDEYDGRAVALVDLFNRGVLDVVVANQNQPALVYKNTVVPGNHWIAFKLVGGGGDAEQPQRDRRGSNGRGRRPPTAAGRRRRDGLREPERPAPAFRPGSEGARGPCRDPLALRGAPSRRAARRGPPQHHYRAGVPHAVTDAALPRAWARLGRLDPRYLVSFLITLILVLGEARYGILGGYERLVIALGVCVATELALARLVGGRSAALQSAYVTGISLALLLKPQTGVLWPFALGAFLAIASKYVLAYRGQHLWNPSNFAISLLLVIAPGSVAILSHQWGNHLATNAVIWAFGLLIAARVRVLHVTLTYVACYVLLAAARSALVGTPVLAEVAPITGPMYQLFIFFMITDPKTTVGSTRGRIAVAALVAVVEAAIRLAADHHVAALRPLYPAPPILALAMVGPVAKAVDLCAFFHNPRPSP